MTKLTDQTITPGVQASEVDGAGIARAQPMTAERLAEIRDVYRRFPLDDIAGDLLAEVDRLVTLAKIHRRRQRMISAEAFERSAEAEARAVTAERERDEQRERADAAIKQGLEVAAGQRARVVAAEATVQRLREALAGIAGRGLPVTDTEAHDNAIEARDAAQSALSDSGSGDSAEPRWVCDWHADLRESCPGPKECPEAAYVQAEGIATLPASGSPRPACGSGVRDAVGIADLGPVKRDRWKSFGGRLYVDGHSAGPGAWMRVADRETHVLVGLAFDDRVRLIEALGGSSVSLAADLPHAGGSPANPGAREVDLNQNTQPLTTPSSSTEVDGQGERVTLYSPFADAQIGARNRPWFFADPMDLAAIDRETTEVREFVRVPPTPAVPLDGQGERMSHDEGMHWRAECEKARRQVLLMERDAWQREDDEPGERINCLRWLNGDAPSNWHQVKDGEMVAVAPHQEMGVFVRLPRPAPAVPLVPEGAREAVPPDSVYDEGTDAFYKAKLGTSGVRRAILVAYRAGLAVRPASEESGR